MTGGVRNVQLLIIPDFELQAQDMKTDTASIAHSASCQPFTAPEVLVDAAFAAV